MDEIVAKVSEKTGLSQEQSQMVVDMVITWVKGKLPESVRGQVDGFLGAGGGANGNIADMAKGALGGLLGGD